MKSHKIIQIDGHRFGGIREDGQEAFVYRSIDELEMMVESGKDTEKLLRMIRLIEEAERVNSLQK